MYSRKKLRSRVQCDHMLELKSSKNSSKSCPNCSESSFTKQPKKSSFFLCYFCNQIWYQTFKNRPIWSHWRGGTVVIYGIRDMRLESHHKLFFTGFLIGQFPAPFRYFSSFQCNSRIFWIDGIQTSATMTATFLLTVRRTVNTKIENVLGPDEKWFIERKRNYC